MEIVGPGLLPPLFLSQNCCYVASNWHGVGIGNYPIRSHITEAADWEDRYCKIKVNHFETVNLNKYSPCEESEKLFNHFQKVSVVLGYSGTE